MFCCHDFKFLANLSLEHACSGSAWLKFEVCLAVDEIQPGWNLKCV